MSPSEILPAVKDLLSRRDEHLGRQGDALELRAERRRAPRSQRDA
jgi:hypothetical protein